MTGDDGRLTQEEFAFYLACEAEVRRRLTALFARRVTDQLDVVAEAVEQDGA